MISKDSRRARRVRKQKPERLSDCNNNCGRAKCSVIAPVRCTRSGVVYRHDISESDGGLAVMGSLLQTTGSFLTS